MTDKKKRKKIQPSYKLVRGGLRKSLASYGVTGRHGVSYGSRSVHTWRRATKRYFHPVPIDRRRMKAKRLQGRRHL